MIIKLTQQSKIGGVELNVVDNTPYPTFQVKQDGRLVAEFNACNVFTMLLHSFHKTENKGNPIRERYKKEADLVLQYRENLLILEAKHEQKESILPTS